MSGIWLLLSLGQLGRPTNSSAWAYQAMQQKEDRCSAVLDRKLVVSGGSSALFGISAEILEKTLNIPTVNIAVHAGLGLEVILFNTRKCLNSGDAVLLALEYELYTKQNYDETSVDYILSRDTVFLKSRNTLEKLEILFKASPERILRGYLDDFSTSSPTRKRSIYNIQFLNKFGDHTSHSLARAPISRASVKQTSDGLMASAVTPEALEKIRDFILFCKSKNIQVVSTFPALYKHSQYSGAIMKAQPGRIESFYSSLEVPMIEPATDLFWPESYFYDTHYHPVEEAKTKRSRELAEKLVNYLPYRDFN